MLAERSGVSRPTIARLERGDEEARASTSWKLAEALGVELRDLTGDTNGDAFDEWCREQQRDRADLAKWLGIAPDQLEALAEEPRARGRSFRSASGGIDVILPPLGW